MSTITAAAAYWTAVLAEVADVDRADAVKDLLTTGTKLKIYNSSNALIRTVTTAAWTRGALALGKYPITPGAFTDPETGSGTPSYVVITSSADVEIMRMPAGVLSGTMRFPSAIAADTAIDPGTFALAYPTDAVAPTGKRWFPGHYLYAADDVNHLGMLESRRNLVKTNANWKGYLNQYWWHSLESTEGVYDFSIITNDLVKAAADGKGLIVRFMDRSFHGTSRPFPVPSYITSTYNGTYQTGSIIYTKLWEPTVNERLLLLLESLFAACEPYAAFQGVQFEESAMSGLDTQASYTNAKFATWLLKMSERMGSAAGSAIFFSNMNWGYSSSATPSRLEIMTEFATVDRIGTGASDARIAGDRNGDSLSYSWKPYDWAGICPLLSGIEYNTYTTDPNRPTRTAKDYLDFGVDTLKLNFMGWMARTSTTGVDFNIYDVIDEVDLQSGRIVTARPTNAPE
jgi:hypothetical protein